MDVLVDVEWTEGGNSKGSVEVVVGDLAVSTRAAESVGRAASEVAPAPEAETCAGRGAACERESDLPLCMTIGVSGECDECCECEKNQRNECCKL